jgi:threonine dehydrogenase-like Zn-dependent dehydrogenase
MGEVVALGKGVTQFRVGDRAAAWRDGPQPRNGFYAQYNNFRAEDLLKVPATLAPADVASLELAMCVEGSFEQLAALGFKLGRLGLGGLGPAGLLAVQLARAHGAKEVIAFDPVASRRELALKLGAHQALAPGAAKWPPSRSEQALDDAIDLTGVPASIEYLMDRTRRCVTLFGVLREEVRYAGMRHMFGPGLILMGYGNHTRTAGVTALRLIKEGKLKLPPLVSQTLPFTRYAEGVELLRTKHAIKILFDPWL